MFTGTLSRIWKEEGIRGLYRGLGPTILGYIPTWAIYFTAYDYFKHRWGKEFGKSKRTQKGEIGLLISCLIGHNKAWLVHIASAMSAGAASTSLTNPLWVIKTRMMVR